ncbi:MAG: MFS transporter [Clostridiales bacterium]|nr:MFS transporter [Clostridiales bacterium]
MWKAKLEAFRLSFSDIFNSKDDYAKGRVIYLGCTLLAAFYNVFITGIFYTGFLTMYGISITGAGIVTFIPYIANIFSIFSSKVLSRFKNRKRALICAKLYFYGMYILATTIMPQLVTDPDQRLMWFVIILFLGYAGYAPFGPGFTVWFYQFYPQDNQRRTRYIMLLQIFSSIMSTIIMLGSSVLTDAVSDSPYQQDLILGLRYLAFVLVAIEIFAIQRKAKDFSPPDKPNMKLSEVFTVPFKYRKFLYCMLMQFCWNYIANLNNGLWNYHLLNHMNFSYTLINGMSALYTVILLCTSAWWSKQIRRMSWIKTFGVTCLFWAPTEFVFFFMTPERAWIYIPMVIAQHLLSVGLNLSYANILYMNLPEENSTSCVAFNTIGCNIFAFLGLISGTFISSLTGDNTVYMLGMNLYSVQFTTVARGVLILAMGFILTTRWRSFTKDADVEEIDRSAQAHKNMAGVFRRMNRDSMIRFIRAKLHK